MIRISYLGLSTRAKKKRADSFVSIVLYIILRQRAVGLWIRVLVFNATFNNISATSCWSILLEEEIGVPEGRRKSPDREMTVLRQSASQC